MSSPPSVPPPAEPPEPPDVPEPPEPPAEQPPPAARSSKRYLDLPPWALGLIIGGIVLMCCVCAAGVCLSGTVFHRIERGRGRAVVTVTACDIVPAARVARVEYVLRNRSTHTRSYALELEVTDGAGVRIGQSAAAVTGVGPGESVRGEGIVMLSAADGVACKARVVR